MAKYKSFSAEKGLKRVFFTITFINLLTIEL